MKWPVIVMTARSSAAGLRRGSVSSVSVGLPDDSSEFGSRVSAAAPVRVDSTAGQAPVPSDAPGVRVASLMPGSMLSLEHMVELWAWAQVDVLDAGPARVRLQLPRDQ